MKGARRVIVHTPEPGAGAGQYVAEFAKALVSAGVPTVLFCPGNFAYQPEVLKSGAEIVRAPMREVYSAGFWRRVFRNVSFTAGAARKFWTTVQKGDIVHFQFASHFRLERLFFLIARLRGASIVLTAHDPLPHRWMLPRSLRWLEMEGLAAGYRKFARIIVHNDAGKRILVERFRCDANCIAVIPHGPLNAVWSATHDATVDNSALPFRLLAFGSLRENKGLHLSIAAIQHLRKSVNKREIALTIAGAVSNTIEQTYWNSCLRLIATQPDGIQVMERVIEDDEIAPLFTAHDAVLLPYVDFSSDSGVAMLALSRQRPIVATRAGGLGELLRECDCGITIESPTKEAVIAAIETAAALPAGILRNKGLSGYSHVLSCRSWEVIARRTLEVYEGLRPSHASEETGQTIVLHTPEPS